MKKRQKFNLTQIISRFLVAIMLFNLGIITVEASKNIPVYDQKVETPTSYQMLKYKNKILAKNMENDTDIYEIDSSGKITFLGEKVSEALNHELLISKTTGKNKVDLLSDSNDDLYQFDFNNNTLTKVNKNTSLADRIKSDLKKYYTVSSEDINLSSIDSESNWVEYNYYYYDKNYDWQSYVGNYNTKTGEIFANNEESNYIFNLYVKDQYSYIEYYNEKGEYSYILKVGNDSKTSELLSIEGEGIISEYIFNDGKSLIAYDEEYNLSIYELQGNTYKKAVTISESLDSSMLYDEYNIDANDNLWRLTTENNKRYVQKYTSGNFISKYEVNKDALSFDVYDDNSLVVYNEDNCWYNSINANEIPKLFTKFEVNAIRTSSTTITGKGLSGAIVEAYVGSTKLGSSTVNLSGSYTINISKQKANTNIVVKMNKTGYEEIQKTIKVIDSSLKYTKTLTKDIYKYDAGKGKYLTYINGKGYSQYVYLNTSEKYAFTPSSWMTAAGLTVTMPTNSNGYTMTVDNNYIDLYNNAKSLLDEIKSGKVLQEDIESMLNSLELDAKEVSKQIDAKIAPKKTLTKDIYKYDAGKGKYLTYINGKGYSQYTYLNKSGNYAFTPSSWMTAAGLTVTMPTKSNGYVMKINNPYITKYNNVIKELKTYL